MPKEILIRDRLTGGLHTRDDEPVKLRVCRGCFRIHDAPDVCAPAA